MKKSVCSLFALVMIGFSVTGCSNKNPYIGTVDTDLKNIKADLVWWNDYAQTGSAAATQRYDYAQNVIKEFNKIYPNISVKQVEYASYSEIAKAVDNGLAGGNIPNIASTYPDNVLSWDTDGAILHAEQYFDDYKLGFGVSMDDKGTFIEDNSTVYADIQANIESEEAAYGSGDLLSLPYSRSSEALFINKTVFDKEGEGKCGQDSDHEVMAGQEEYVAPTANASKKKYSVPKDWKEMISLARQMKKDFSIFSDANQRDQDGWFINVPICYDSGDNLFISFSKMAGIDYADQEKPLFNNDAAKQMMIQLKKWNNEGLLCTADQLTWSRTAPEYHSYSTSMVNYGQVFMLVSSTTSGMYLGVDGYNIDVYPTPTFGTDDYDNPASNATSGKHYAISQGPSLALFENCVNIGESVSLFRGLGLALAKAAFCLMLLGRYKEAEVHLQRMGKIYNIMHTEWEDGLQGGGLAFSIMGVLNCRKKDWYHAGICFNVAKRLVNEAKRPLWQAMLYWAKLELYKMGDELPKEFAEGVLKHPREWYEEQLQLLKHKVGWI